MGQVIRRGAAVIVVVLLATFDAGSQPVPGEARSPAPTGSDSAVPDSAVPVNSLQAKRVEPVLRLDFDRGHQRSGAELTSFRSSGTAPVRVRSVTWNHGAVVRRPGHPEGWAVRLPEYSTSDPGYAVVRVTNDGPDRLSPRSGPFAFGADFALNVTSSGTGADNGDNLVQRGLYGDAGQYKIQVDDRQASCRVKGSTGDVAVAAAGSVRFRSIGGKLYDDGSLALGATDQFNGSVDRVFYRRLG